MNEKKFDELLKSEQLLAPDEKLEKRIHRSINRKIYAKSFKVFLCTILCLGLLTCGFSKLMDLSNYDPTSENDFVVSSEKATAGFDVLTATYINMYIPGITCQTSTQFSKSGFGNYEITYALSDTFKPMIAGVGENHTLKITRSQITVEADGQWLLARQVYEYLNPDDDEASKEAVLKYGNPEDEYEDLLKLPDSAVIDVALSFPKTRNADELMTFINKYPDSSFIWVALDTNETIVHGTATGFSLYESWADALTEEAKSNYPSFYVSKDELNAKTMTENYLSKLKLLADHPAFTQMMDAFFLNEQVDYDAKYQHVLENGIEAIGIRGHLTKADLLQMIDTKEISHMTIRQVKLSKYS